ncbi:MAG: type I secretion system permease/ATPase [Phyllobacteriaceae bacterium]|nr:type I secretion system permease/ATPase [Phyllobacteriaceae bacterium]
MALAPGKMRNEVTTELWSHKRVWASVLIFSCIINVLMLTGSVFMMQVYDRVLTSGSVPTLIALSAIVFILYLYYGFLENVRVRLLLRKGRAFEETLRDRVYDVVAMLALKKVPSTGGQPMQDMATIRQFLSGQGPLAFLDMPWVPIYLLVVFMLHPVLGVAGLLAAVVIYVLALLTERTTRKAVGEATHSASRAAALNEESRRNAEAQHALGMRNALRGRWSKLQQEAMDASSVAGDRGGIFSTASRVTRMLVQSGILALGAYLAIQREISPGTIIAASIIMSRGLAPIEQAVGNWQQFLSFRKAIERLDKTLNLVPPEIDRMKLPAPKGVLEVENLTVVVPGIEKPILQGLNFKVMPGAGLGVIGPTGAGKSTLSRALVGVVDAVRGSVRLDGATLDQRSDEDRGRAIGYLPQDVQLFDGTVAQNISRFADQPNAADIVEAATLANVHNMITRLPQGYDTPLGESGAKLSAGQRQRLALARALYGKPALVVMDEPNSNLDAEGEVALDGAIRACLSRGAAVVIVAHRPSALQALKDVLVLSDGKQAAYGKREDVFKQVTRPRTVPNPEGQHRISATPTIIVPETRN